MKNKKKLSFKKMNVAQLDATKGGQDWLEIFRTFPSGTVDQESQQPVGGICYSNSPTSCMVCV